MHTNMHTGNHLYQIFLNGEVKEFKCVLLVFILKDHIVGEVFQIENSEFKIEMGKSTYLIKQCCIFTFLSGYVEEMC